ncbi:MAG: transcriptional repressor [Rhizobiaceae bacterium]|nr:transcriptional repressor [Rhizobiaceae bacterium]MBL4696784.1 transcriptional repressor [Rhizobiaceae bacterium]
MNLLEDNCSRLRAVNLRPTKQRLALADLLFAKGDRHVSAENLFEEAKQAGVAISLATVYNTLHQFTESKLLKAIAIDSNRTYFDTNVGDHNHFYIEGTDELIDMPECEIRIENLPSPPEGMEISGMDIVVRIRPSRKS